METVVFDFNDINTKKEFLNVFRQNFKISADFVCNLDGLWDALTGMINLPVEVRFENISLAQLEKFQMIITLFEESQEETEGKLQFSYFIEK